MGSITSAVCGTFKQDCLNAAQNCGTAVFKLALIKAGPTGTYNAATTNYSQLVANGDEVVGTGYAAGGVVVAATVSLQSNVATIDFANASWLASSISADGFMIYNSSASNKATCVVSFGGTQADVAGTFAIVMPASGAATSMIQFN